VSRKTGAVVLKGLDNLPERSAVKFTLRIEGYPAEGFVIKMKEGLKAYVNRCPHAGTTLDFGDNDFFTDDGRWLHCKTHGALFEPADGACAGGPCAGKGLDSLSLERRANGDYVVRYRPRDSRETS
jgi:nitrite reductase/ring-hydroxylating ferredoxin subunit